MSIDRKLLPGRCRECARPNISDVHGKCELCLNLGFQEEILCDLNRCVQDEPGFECYAFQPTLKLLGASENHVDESDEAFTGPEQEKGLSELLDSDKIKYERALALQKLGRDPDGVYVQLKYHFAWNVSFRRSVFSPANDFIGFVNDTFLRCSELAGGFVDLLHLAPDHVHLYVESDGELSVEEMVHRIKRFSNNAILKEFPLLRDKLGGDIEIWEEAYFVETVS
ncbi:MAG: IS200/IS605 family transposase [Deltaproteobacteria bacterium]|nr:IS200/IS605 family transposase [Deltaproteobacteria bacterium]